MNKTCSKIVSPLLLIASTGLFAVEPNPLQIGIFDVIPQLSVDVQNNDNIYRVADNERDSIITVIAPQLSAVAIDGMNSYGLDFQGFKGTYADSSDDDYTDWRVGANAHMEFTSRNLLDLNIGYNASHEDRGTGRSQFLSVPSSPDEYDVFDYGLRYQFGAADSRGRLVFDLSGSDREYQSNPTFNEIYNYTQLGLGATFYFNVLARTDMFFQVQLSDFDYDDNPAALPGQSGSFGSNERGAYVGLSWEATANTTGSVKVGILEKDFDDDFRADADNPAFQAGIEWTPLTYSVFNFDVSRSFEEGNGFGNAREQTQFGFGWRHSWSNRIDSQLSFSRRSLDYIGVALDEDLNVFFASLNYSFARWLDFHIEITTDTRDSSRALFDHEQNVISIGFDASL